jgi:ribosomal protein S18 acetylase RimI-like enzyme
MTLVSRLADIELPEWCSAESLRQFNQRQISGVLERLDAEASPGPVVLVADGGTSTLLGFIVVQKQTDYFTGEDYASILNLVVHANVEGRGIGRILVEAAERWAKDCGFRSSALEVFATNRRARQFYEKIGYREEVVKYVKQIKRE